MALHVLGQPLSAAAPSFAIAGQPSPQPQPSFPAASSSPAASFAQSELDASTLQYLSHLQQLKAAAIEAEDFDSAKVLATAHPLITYAPRAHAAPACRTPPHSRIPPQRLHGPLAVPMPSYRPCCALTSLSPRCVCLVSGDEGAHRSAAWCRAAHRRVREEEEGRHRSRGVRRGQAVQAGGRPAERGRAARQRRQGRSGRVEGGQERARVCAQQEAREQTCGGHARGGSEPAAARCQQQAVRNSRCAAGRRQAHPTRQAVERLRRPRG